jgi:hypothetical protein
MSQSVRRPTRSTKVVEMRVAPKRTRPVQPEATKEADEAERPA